MRWWGAVWGGTAGVEDCLGGLVAGEDEGGGGEDEGEGDGGEEGGVHDCWLLLCGVIGLDGGCR